MAGSMVDDLATLPELDEATLVKQIKLRYDKEKIYTYIGDILIALNPYRRVPLYGAEQWQNYKEVATRSSLPPHIYIISDSAYQSMRRNNADQCCVVSGESGAGKTESTKFLIEHIAQLCRKDTSDLHSRIVQVNPMLEAFGNAQTVINNNSSRFGKFIELVFDQNGQIQGAKLSEYLLEKSRVVTQSAGERNFHMFYYMFAGLEEEELQMNLLNKPEDHRIMRSVNNDPTYANKEELRESKAKWTELLSIMNSVGFTKDDIDGILAVLAAILHITDIQFIEDPETDGVYIENEKIPSIAAQLLAVNLDSLVTALISSVSAVGSGSEKVTSLKNISQACDGRDALGKALYGRLFGWIVRQINTMLEPKKIEEKAKVTIGILDIYGFENLAVNSFEQMCINVANEQLQYFFNQHIFKSELDEYEREGVSSSNVTFVDNWPLIELFLEPLGILSRLDDESKFPAATDQSFVEKLSQNFVKRQDLFQTPKGQRPEFMITHFAGVVTYCVTGFLEKNRDTLGDSITMCMKESLSRFVADLFSPVSDLGALQIDPSLTIRRRNWRMSKLMSGKFTLPPVTPVNSNNLLKRLSVMVGQNQSPAQQREAFGTISRGSVAGESSKTTRTLASHFKNSLADLLEKLLKSQPHFIRCIKPNAKKSANSFDQVLVVQQLRYTGVLETVKIRKQGYSARLTFEDFTQRFKVLSTFSSNKMVADSQTCSQALQRTGLKEWQIGKTKVFLKYWHMEKLNGLVKQVHERIIQCQSFWRAVIARRELQKMKAAARLLAEHINSLSDIVAQASAQHKKLQEQLCQEDEVTHERLLKEARIAKKKAVQSLDNAVTSPSVSVAKELPSSPKLQQIAPVETIAIGRSKRRENVENVYNHSTIPEEAQQTPTGNPPGFSPNSTDETTTQALLDETTVKLSGLSVEIWGKIYYMEKNCIQGKVYLRDWDVIINNGSEQYDGQTIGINSFEHITDPDISECLTHIGKGVEIKRDIPGNIYVRKLTQENVIMKGFGDLKTSCFPPEFVKSNGKLGNESTKVFDIEVYKKLVSAEMEKLIKKPESFDPHLLNRLSVIRFSFWRDSPADTDTPCWVSIINFAALDLLGQDHVFNELTQLKLKFKPKEEPTLRQRWRLLNYMRRTEGTGYADTPIKGTLTKDGAKAALAALLRQ